MPQPLRRADAPIDWNIRAVSNHLILTSGVGACITAFATAEALMGLFLAMIRWEHAPEAVERWAMTRTTKDKLELIKSETEISETKLIKLTELTLNDFVSLAKMRSKLAHGYFGIITDRENQFAWRKGDSAARRMAIGLASSSLKKVAKPPTWVFIPQDFSDLAQACANMADKIEIAVELLPMVHGLASSQTRANKQK
jgi:hypothetical protein